MAGTEQAPFRAQDVREIAEMLRGLEENKGKGKGKGGFSCKKNTFDVDGSSIKVDSWRMQEWDYKKPHLPTYARGLFTTKTSKGQPEIVTRGYDKFFNEREVRETEWRNVERDTRGPYELSVKENGCIIFLSGLEDGTLLVCSKHSTGYRADIDVSHAKAGETWVERHLAGVGKTKPDLALRLRQMNATAVAELCDDEFEEHVLAYSPESAGLYLHGINLNLPEFATYPHHLIDRFADEWGFKKTTYIIKHDINEVKNFLEEIAITGNYDGRDTEGFVIRCQSKANTGQWHDWFFKYKFDEPYLMYRQWRECTKAIISGRDPKYKKHQKITAEYLSFASKELHANPGLGTAYQQNHGIIKLRDDFLASRGVSGADLIREEEGDEDSAAKNDFILVPAATIGCGKTTVALALCKLFHWGHVQNDNITVKKGKPQAFAAACVKGLTNTRAMVADRNNHQKRERAQLIEDVSTRIREPHFVCLHYVHERGNYDRIREATRERVLERGDNHQTIHASKGREEIIGIMEGFMHRFEPVNRNASPDSQFDLIIDLDPCASSRENLETVITRLYTEYPLLFEDQEMPTSDEMDAAIEAALHDYTVDIKHEIKSRDDRNQPKQQKQNPTNGTINNLTSQPKPKEKKVEYFAVHLPATRVSEILDAIFRDTTDPETRKFYSSLKQQRRIQPEFHVTLIHRASAQQHAEYWSHLNDLHASASAPTDDRAFVLPEPKLGSCKVRLERLVWNDRIMAFVVRLSPGGQNAGEHWHTVNANAHVTVGTAAPSVKPVESNDLLAQWLREGTGGNGIREVLVKGNVELEGTVKGVLQKF